MWRNGIEDINLVPEMQETFAFNTNYIFHEGVGIRSREM